MMDTRKCPACGHQNKPGAASCARCSTSLNLKLCAACEAANPLTAEKCYECGASLVDGAPANDGPVPVPVAAAERLFEEAPRIRLLPLHPKVPARTGRFARLWIVSVAVAAGGGYYFASRAPFPVAAPGPAAAALHPEARAETLQPAAEARVEPTQPVAKSVSADPAKRSVAQPASAPKRASAPVTHTHTASTGAAAAATAAPAAAVEEPAAAEAAAASYTHITRTKPGETLEKPVAPLIEQPVNNQPAGCAPAVAALGLCPAK